MYKKIKFAGLLALAILFSSSCYSDWLNAYNDATAEYQSDLDHCNSSWNGSDLCYREAELSYGAALWAAGNEYINCDEL